MSSVAQEARAEGFSELLDTDGETLTLDRTPPVTLTALVNRDPFEKVRGDSPSFTPADVSSIEFRIADLAGSEIEVGETFSDMFSHSHRVKSIKRMGEIVRCHCEVSG